MSEVVIHVYLQRVHDRDGYWEPYLLRIKDEEVLELARQIQSAQQDTQQTNNKGMASVNDKKERLDVLDE